MTELDKDEDIELTDDEAFDQFEVHANRIGRVTISWNFAHSLIFVIFGQMAKMEFENSRAVFFAIKQDFHQREMTIALARAELSDTPKVRDKVIAAISHFNNLSTERNAIIHTIWTPPTKTEPIKSQPYAKLFYKGYDQDGVGERIDEFNQKIRTAHRNLMIAFGLILKRDASRNKLSELHAPQYPED